MIIYYLSGTGNSLYTARALARELKEEVTLHSFKEIRTTEEIYADDDAVGFVFPVYFVSVPEALLACIRRMYFRPGAYLFAVATCNGVPGVTLSVLHQALREKRTCLNAGFTLDMPGNALITPAAEAEKQLADFPGKIKQISCSIEKRAQVSWNKTTLSERLRSAAVRKIGPSLVVNPKNFYVEEERCTGCGLCRDVCPASNITISSPSSANGSASHGHPQWKADCIRCLACFHWCPRQAIRIGGSLSDRPRYRHPQISAADIC